MRWKVYVSGHPIDLGILRGTFPSNRGAGGLVFNESERGTYFETDRLDSHTDAGERHRAADKVLREINGLARVLDSSFRPVTLEGRYDDETRRNTQVVAVDTLEMRSHVSVGLVVNGGDGQAKADPHPPGPSLFAMTDSHPDHTEALLLMGGPAPLGWFELYKLYEVIKHNVGGDEDLVATGWTTRKELSAFRVSANRQDVSGSDARHARSSNADLPTRTMTLAEARDYMRLLARKWLGSLV